MKEDILVEQRELHSIRTPRRIPRKPVEYNPRIENDDQCSRAERYFQAALHQHSYGDASHINRDSHRICLTGIYHDGLPVGVLKDYEEPTMLCTQMIQGHDKHTRSKAYMKRGHIYTVSDNVTQHAGRTVDAATVDHIAFNRSRPLKEHNLRRVTTPHPFPDMKTVSDVLLHADRFLLDKQRHA